MDHLQHCEYVAHNILNQAVADWFLPLKQVLGKLDVIALWLFKKREQKVGAHIKVTQVCNSEIALLPQFKQFARLLDKVSLLFLREPLLVDALQNQRVAIEDDVLAQLGQPVRLLALLQRLV